LEALEGAGKSGVVDPREEEPAMGVEGGPEEGARKGTMLGLSRDKQL